MKREGIKDLNKSLAETVKLTVERLSIIGKRPQK